MKENVSISIGKQGMNRDAHPSNLQETQYTIAFNANYEDESGSGIPQLQNEHSNILCTKFKEGFKVIGYKNDLNEDKTYYFLVNPETCVSEIGCIKQTQCIKTITDAQVQCECDITGVLNKPLEEQIQVPYCKYETIISDQCYIDNCEGFDCKPCIGFSIDHPIRQGNIQIKDEKCGKRLYWTDNYNPPRFIDLDNLEQYYYTGGIDCGDEPEEICFDCKKLNIFPCFERPCITPVTIKYGGSLKAGVYEFLVAYCDSRGNEISEYYSITNPISIFDETNNVLTQDDLNYITNQGIRLEVTNLDNQYSYYKVAVIQRADVNAATSYFIEGVHPISDTSVSYYTDVDKQRTTLNNLLATKPIYTQSGIMTSSNGYLFQADLTVEKEINLQPVVSLMSLFLRWQTVKAKESLYKDGVNNSLYRGYMRDETYPFSIRFTGENGYTTAKFPFIGRPATPEELEPLGADNKDLVSITEYSANCVEKGRDKRWQVYNTASVLDTDCSEDQEVVDDCDPVPYQVGKFAYIESEETYPDNEELFDSRFLEIDAFRTNPTITQELEEAGYVDGLNADFFVLTDEVDFRCKPIRHFKFPDNCTSPFMSSDSNGVFQEADIHPLGVTIDPEIIRFFLDVAQNNGLLTQEQRENITGYEIFRGDRSLDKSIIAKGLAYDMYKYNELDGVDEDIYYPNYPYNDLGPDDLHFEDETQGQLIQHPFGGTENNRYTFHSPDVHFHKPQLPTEVHIEGFQCGKSAGRFTEVQDHPKWVILSNAAFATATTLAIVEAGLELATLYGDFQVQNAIAGDRTYDGDIDIWGSYFSQFNLGLAGAGTSSLPSIPNPINGPQDNQQGGADAGGPPFIEGNEGEINSYNNGAGTLGGEIDLNTNIDFTNTNDDKLNFIEKTALVLGLLTQIGPKIQQNRAEWLKIFKETGQPQNFAYYYTSEGYYNFFKCNPDEGNKVRGLCGKKYLKQGRVKVQEKEGDATKVNNFNRESSVYLSFGDCNLEYPVFFQGQDNSRFISSDVPTHPIYGIDNGLTDENGDPIVDFSYTSRSPEVYSDIGSPYMSLKNYIPSQYGRLSSVRWLPTGHCGDLFEECPRVFGGDTFISRFSLKRKVPQFLVTAMDLADLTPFNYYPYRNIGHPQFYVDYDTTSANDTGVDLTGGPQNGFFGFVGTLIQGILGLNSTIDIRSVYDLDDFNVDGFYVKPPSKFYLYYYGIPQFLVESEINVNYRYARREIHEDFYPRVGDYEEWTQEKNVSIRHDNTYYYNDTYSKNTSQIACRALPDNYSQEEYDCKYDSPNGIIWSQQDNSEQDFNDPWLNYKPLDFYQFKTSSGRLIDIRDIESAQLLARFENHFMIINAVDQIRDRLTPQNQELGTGGIFAHRPLEFKKTDLGYAGTQHKEMVSCEYGHFWVDAKRGQVFQVDQNGRNLKEITTGLRNWFKEHLPFKIMRGNVVGLDSDNLDYNYKGLGIAMGWDSRFRRVFLTKRDYIIRPRYKGRLVFNEGVFTLDGAEVQLTNKRIFKDVSFTLAYSPITQSWISYYSFKPDYYVSHHNYFQTGLNYASDESMNGLWSHLLTNKSYTVFYGKKHGWLIELPVKEQYANKILKSVEYWMDTRRYHNEYDFAEFRKLGFNKSWIYNHSANSGQLNLITEIPNNQQQKLQYPITNLDSQDILTTEQERRWTYNTFYNRVRDEYNNVPIWNYDENQINKFINMDALQYEGRCKDRMRGDWFLLRMAQDEETRYKQIFKWLTTKELIYNH